MDSENGDTIVLSLHDPRLERTIGQRDKAAGEVCEFGGAAGEAGTGVSSDWLNDLADALSERSWVELDLSARVPNGLLQALRDEVRILHKTESMARAGIGRGAELTRDRSVRRDKIAWLDGVTAAQAELFRFFEALRLGLNQRLYLGLKRFEAHYATYQPGDFYLRHLDSFKGRASRALSLVLYLNEGWGLEDGGELRAFRAEHDDEVVSVMRPELGRAMLFLSEEIPHEVLPARRTRHSIACWFRQDEVPLPL